jgi:hypothetical protein
MKKGSNLTITKIEDGKVYIPIPLAVIEGSGVNFNMPVTVAGLDTGGILIFNPGITNPDFISSILKSGLN